jgi:hypothetical protein
VAGAGLALGPGSPPDVPLPAAGTSVLATATGATSPPGSADPSTAEPPPVWTTAGATLVAEELGLAAPVDEVHLVGGDLGVPDDPLRVGWWTGSAVPGSTQGTVVVDGHVNYDGVTGALAVLPSMTPGDRVELRSGTTVIPYTVQTVQSYPKADGLPADLFTTGGPARLTIITCGGTYDQDERSYEDNVVVTAAPG